MPHEIPHEMPHEVPHQVPCESLAHFLHCAAKENRLDRPHTTSESQSRHLLVSSCPVLCLNAAHLCRHLIKYVCCMAEAGGARGVCKLPAEQSSPAQHD